VYLGVVVAGGSFNPVIIDGFLNSVTFDAWGNELRAAVNKLLRIIVAVT
jgi:hypothetical protein